MKETIQNLTKAFIGESQARNRYTYYAKVAKNEGYEQIAAIFLETAEQEKIHAKRLFEHINELKQKIGDPALNEIIVEAVAPTAYGTTEQNLAAGIAGEHYEYSEMYPTFAAKAKEEGLPLIAGRLLSIAKAEQHHEERYKKLLSLLKGGKVFSREQKTLWVCRECGYVHEGAQPPKKCPACNHASSYFQIKSEEY